MTNIKGCKLVESMRMKQDKVMNPLTPDGINLKRTITQRRNLITKRKRKQQKFTQNLPVVMAHSSIRVRTKLREMVVTDIDTKVDQAENGSV
jgi:hypothetical protein